MIDAAFLQACAPQIPPAVSYAIVRTESSFRPYAIGVNRSAGLKRQPANYTEAVTYAKNLIAAGKNIDLGLAQINSSNLQWLGLSIEKAFDPCSNLKAMQRVYLDCLARAGNSGQGTPMQRAWSCYNTGNHRRGFSNGYVSKVTQHYNAVFNHAIPQVQQVTKSSTRAPVSVIASSSSYQPQNNKTSLSEPSHKEIEHDLTASSLSSHDVVIKNNKTYANWDVFNEFEF